MLKAREKIVVETGVPYSMRKKRTISLFLVNNRHFIRAQLSGSQPGCREKL